MGVLCSSVDKDGDEPEGKAQAQSQSQLQSQKSRRLHKVPKMPQVGISRGWAKSLRSTINNPQFSTAEEYFEVRGELVKAEKATAFDAEAVANASDIEKQATRIVHDIRNYDWDHTYGKPPSEKRLDENGVQIVERTAGEHFLGNVDLINKTELMKVAKRMPKGAHLHVHFNSCLSARFLIEQARDVDAMWILSTHPLTTDRNFADCRIRFDVLTEENAKTQTVDGTRIPIAGETNIFKDDYHPLNWMKYKLFQQLFKWTDGNGTHYEGAAGAEAWLQKKMEISEEEAHSGRQTSRGIWERFNYRTQMMKGLFVYESAYRNYTQACIKDFVEDNIQYAEIRPNFMKNNSLKSDDGRTTLDNAGIMGILDEGLNKAMDEIRQEGHYFGGMKVIYCTPRSFSNALVESALNECIELKKKFSHLICGFDLVGHEEMGKELRNFVPEFLQFVERCKQEKLEIPFLFHCGETLEVGDKVDGNLFDAVLLNAKRIGHGYAITQHPLIMEIFKEKNIAIESCPISNEVLGLTPVMAGHHLPILLANNVPCTINSDNATFYKSSLSHDFYQVMIGSEDMSLLGWKQLAKWSLEHSCMEPEMKTRVTADWKKKWDGYCQWIVDTYGHLEGYQPSSRH